MGIAVVVWAGMSMRPRNARGRNTVLNHRAVQEYDCTSIYAFRVAKRRGTIVRKYRHDHLLWCWLVYNRKVLGSGIKV